jgi:RNA polymerase sigma factor (sigma-70 family)
MQMTIAMTTVMSEHAEDVPAAPQATRREANPTETTMDLLEQMKQGDSAALEAIFRRSIPALQRWAHGRLPRSSRGMLDTCDLVQDTVVSALRHLDSFEARRQGALQAYLRQAIVNRIRDLARRDRCRPTSTSLPDDLVDGGRSPLEHIIGTENQERYVAALKHLSERDRDAIVGRIELHYSYDQLAVVLGTPTPNAARAAVGRAMNRLVQALATIAE